MGGLFQKKVAEPPTLTGDPLLPGVLAQLVKGDFAKARRLLALEPAELRYFYAFQLAGELTRAQVLAWPPDCPESLLLRAAHGPQWAWQARSNQQAQQVSQAQRQGFAERLALAHQDINQLPEHDPNRWALQLLVAKGENLPLLESARLYARIQDDHYFGACNFLDSQLQKWGGAPGQALDFASGLVEGSSEGTPFSALVAVALTEQWLFLDAFEKKPDRAEAVRTDPGFLELSRKAYERGLGSPNFHQAPHYIQARNDQAFWFYLSNQREPLKRELKQLGKRFTQYPWSYLGVPGQVFADARRRAGC